MGVMFTNLSNELGAPPCSWWSSKHPLLPPSTPRRCCRARCWLWAISAWPKSPVVTATAARSPTPATSGPGARPGPLDIRSKVPIPTCPPWSRRLAGSHGLAGEDPCHSILGEWYIYIYISDIIWPMCHWTWLKLPFGIQWSLKISEILSSYSPFTQEQGGHTPTFP